jgi:cytoskeleton protein RodZ
MSETEALVQDETSPQPTAGGAQPSAGSLLRAAREQAGMDLQELAVTLKVPARKIEALEADQLEELPDAMFVRALASSICRALRVDPAPILERLPQSGHRPFEKTNTGLNTPFRATRVRSSGGGMPWLGHLVRPGALVVAALLLGALALFLVPSLPTVERLLSKTQAPTPVLPPGGLAVDVADTAVRPAAENPQSSVAPPLRPAAGPNAAASIAVPALTATAALKPPSSDLLAFTVNAATWVEVADAKGKMPLRRVLNAGEKVNVEGSLPMRVIVGRADAVRVDVRGQPLDITTLAKDNVARFEVK